VRSLLLISLLLASPAFAGAEQGALVVVIDPGHGGKWPHDGARGPRGQREKTVVLSVARRTKAILEAEGATVVLTREHDEDISIAERARIANEAGADLFLSIHCNSMEKPEDREVTKGVETYFLSPDPTDAEAKLLAEMENGGPEAVPIPRHSDALSGILADLALGQARNDSAALAQIIHRYMVHGARAASRGVRQAPFLVLSGTKMPSALVEIGFISHPQEARQLGRKSYQTRIARALADGVRDFADKVLARRLFAQVKPPDAPVPAPAPSAQVQVQVASPAATR